MRNGRRQSKKNEALKLDSTPITTVLASDIAVKGDINGNETIRIDGKVEGNIDVKKGIIIGENGKIEGNLKSDYIIVYGFMNGSIFSKELMIKTSGVVNGDITTESIEIELGGKYNGKLTMQTEQTKLLPEK